MAKRTLIVLTLVITFILAVEPLQSAHGILMSADEAATLNATDTSTGGTSADSSSQGNGFVRALKTPFRTIGRLFGRKKKDDNRLQRISNDDIKKFESVPGQQTSTNSTTVATAPEVRSENRPADTAIHLEKGRELLNSGKLNEAIASLSLAASLDPNSGEAHSLLGVAYENKGLRDLALKSLKAAVKAEKDSPQLLNNFGFLLYRNGDYEDATKYLKQAAKLAPDDARILNNLGLAQFNRNKFSDAYRSFAQAMGEYKGHLIIATRLERRGYPKDAIKHLEKALALEPASKEVLAKLVTLYEITGNDSDAARARSSLVALQTFAEASK